MSARWKIKSLGLNDFISISITSQEITDVDLEQVAWPAYKVTSWHKHTRTDGLAQASQWARRNSPAQALNYTVSLLLFFVFAHSFVFIYSLVFYSHSVSSRMQVRCWLCAVFLFFLQGPRGLVGSRGPPGAPGQTVSQHHLDEKIKTIESLQIQKHWNIIQTSKDKQKAFWTVQS